MGKHSRNFVRKSMYPMIPGDVYSGALEMMCYGFTVVAAFLSCLLTLRF